MVRVCGNHDDAEDALLEAIVSALRHSGQLRDPAAFRGWLAAIARRACIRIRSKDQSIRTEHMEELESHGIEVPDPGQSPQWAAENEELKSCVSMIVQNLPESLRNVYIHREIMREPAETVAAELGLTVSATKARLNRARKLVRQAFDAEMSCAGWASAPLRTLIK